MIAYSYYPSVPGGCRAMPVARCCAAIPKQRDSLMLSYKLGFPFREIPSCCHTSWAFHSERRPHAVIHAGLYPCRETALCCHTSRAFHSEICPHAVIHARQPIQRDVLMLSYKMGCNPDYPCIAAGGHDIKHEESAQGRCRHMASPCADSP